MIGVGATCAKVYADSIIPHSMIISRNVKDGASKIRAEVIPKLKESMEKSPFESGHSSQPGAYSTEQATDSAYYDSQSVALNEMQSSSIQTAFLKEDMCLKIVLPSTRQHEELRRKLEEKRNDMWANSSQQISCWIGTGPVLTKSFTEYLDMNHQVHKTFHHIGNYLTIKAKIVMFVVEETFMGRAGEKKPEQSVLNVKRDFTDNAYRSISFLSDSVLPVSHCSNLFGIGVLCERQCSNLFGIDVLCERQCSNLFGIDVLCEKQCRNLFGIDVLCEKQCRNLFGIDVFCERQCSNLFGIDVLCEKQCRNLFGIDVFCERQCSNLFGIDVLCERQCSNLFGIDVLCERQCSNLFGIDVLCEKQCRNLFGIDVFCERQCSNLFGIDVLCERQCSNLFGIDVLYERQCSNLFGIDVLCEDSYSNSNA
ncbi:hypothetical protein ANN_24598 [Periplaneta americana]|uniref:Uncharacterized protein n=1 Tax=Periplaneta americana TaxID=6978 RepID=A0ABQ8S3T9_PERAM|nr:hypothetical protein ANN_24598 [Periplaneta americana]